MIPFRAWESDERRCKFQLRILATHADRFFCPAISVKASRRVRLAPAHPPLVGFGQVAHVERRQHSNVIGTGIGRARVKSSQQFFSI